MKISCAENLGVEVPEVYEEVYRELPEFGPDNKTCVIRIDGGSYYKSGYMFYTAASESAQGAGQGAHGDGGSTEFLHVRSGCHWHCRRVR